MATGAAKLLLMARTVAAGHNGLARTPPMGWNPYNCLSSQTAGKADCWPPTEAALKARMRSAEAEANLVEEEALCCQEDGARVQRRLARTLDQLAAAKAEVGALKAERNEVRRDHKKLLLEFERDREARQVLELQSAAEAEMLADEVQSLRLRCERQRHDMLSAQVAARDAASRARAKAAEDLQAAVLRMRTSSLALLLSAAR